MGSEQNKFTLDCKKPQILPRLPSDLTLTKWEGQDTLLVRMDDAELLDIQIDTADIEVNAPGGLQLMSPISGTRRGAGIAHDSRSSACGEDCLWRRQQNATCLFGRCWPTGGDDKHDGGTNKQPTNLVA